VRPRTYAYRCSTSCGMVTVPCSSGGDIILRAASARSSSNSRIMACSLPRIEQAILISIPSAREGSRSALLLDQAWSVGTSLSHKLSRETKNRGGNRCVVRGLLRPEQRSRRRKAVDQGRHRLCFRDRYGGVVVRASPISRIEVDTAFRRCVVPGETRRSCRRAAPLWRRSALNDIRRCRTS